MGSLFVSSMAVTLKKVMAGAEAVVAVDVLFVTKALALLQLQIKDFLLLLNSDAHTMASVLSSGKPVFILPDQSELDLFYCIEFPQGCLASEILLLEHILQQHTILHYSERKVKVTTGAKSRLLPNFKIPQVQFPTPEQVTEIIHKAAQDTSLVLAEAGKVAHQALQGASELHKKFAPQPTDEAVKLDPHLMDKVKKTKLVTEAGKVMAAGVAAGVAAGSREVGTSLADMLMAFRNGNSGGTAQPPGTSVLPSQQPNQAQGSAAPMLKSVAASPWAAVGVELMNDVARVRAAACGAVDMLREAAKEVTVGVYRYQYGEEVAQVMADGLGAVEGVAAMVASLQCTRLTNVALETAKHTAKALGDKREGGGVGAPAVGG